MTWPDLSPASATYTSPVDPTAEHARQELRAALEAAFPKEASTRISRPEQSARDELLSALGAGTPTDSSYASGVEKAASLNLGVGEAPAASSAPTSPPGDTGDAGSADPAGTDNVQEGIENLRYLSRQPASMRVAWAVQKANQLRCDGNKLFRGGDWTAAGAKYRSALDLLGNREDFPEDVRRTHDDLVVLCGCNLSACALRAGDCEEALRLSERVLHIEPTHVKARFRRALAILRRGVEKSESCDGLGPRWAAPHPNGGGSSDVGRAAGRPEDLLEVQRELEAICSLCPRDTTVSDAVKELYERAKAERVRLRPPTWVFPKRLRDFEYSHAPAPDSADGAPGRGGPGTERNLLVMVHGFGGRKDSFVDLAANLRLPKTACLVLNGPFKLPEDLLDDPPGYSWFTMLDDDMEFIAPAPVERRRIKSLKTTGDLLLQTLGIIASTCGWSPCEVFLFGYGQGGSLCLDLLLRPDVPDE